MHGYSYCGSLAHDGYCCSLSRCVLSVRYLFEQKDEQHIMRLISNSVSLAKPTQLIVGYVYFINVFLQNVL